MCMPNMQNTSDLQSACLPATNRGNDVIEQPTRSMEHVDTVMSWLRDAIVPLYVETEKPQKSIQQVRRQKQSTAIDDTDSSMREYLKLIEKTLEQVNFAFH